MYTKQPLAMVRGDTFSFDVDFSEIGGVAVVEELFFTVKKSTSEVKPILQKAIYHGFEVVDANTFRCRVEAQDTDGVAVGRYVYDIQVTIGNDVHTIMFGPFEIVEDVTRWTMQYTR